MLFPRNFSGSKAGNSGNAKVNVDIPITLVTGKNTIDLLSLTVGLQVHIFLLYIIKAYTTTKSWFLICIIWLMSILHATELWSFL